MPADCPAAGSAPRPQREAHDYHPLEIIGFFRRFEPGTARDLLYTFIWNCLIATAYAIGALAFSVKGITLERFGVIVLVANLIGYSIHALFLVGHLVGFEKRVRVRGTVAMALYYTGFATVGVVVGMFLAALIFEIPFMRWFSNPRWFVAVAASSFMISAILTGVFMAREKSARAEAALERERLRAERVEREATLAHLRALQAQIEPHFLFNTLANVVSLIDPDPATARRMLERFIRFLRASLAATRSEATTLGAEAELISAYLDVLQIRMGERLRIAIEIDPGLAGFAIPPMLLQPVVENAIRHGLEPKVQGGDVAFRARREGDRVVIEIADTGVGFASTTTGGVGLTNLRDRLRLLYGDRGALEIRENGPEGAIVTLRIPA